MTARHREAHDLPLRPNTFSFDMARRSRNDLLLLGRSLLRYNRVGLVGPSIPLSSLVAGLAYAGQL
eukprot:2344036-Pyramimonas_sp.AAC.1